MSDIFVTADTHFFHHNILKYSAAVRPFNTVDEMNAVIMTRWNAVVRPDDVVYHLGDVAFCSKAVLSNLMSGLNGRKMLVLGNHDRKQDAMLECGFDEVSVRRTIAYGGYELKMSHLPYYDPLDQWDSKHKEARWEDDGKSWLLCGHVHMTWKVKGRMVNVGQDQWDLTPVRLREVVDLIRSTEDMRREEE